MATEHYPEDSYAEPQEELPQIASWEEIEMYPELHRGIYAYGFDSPSGIQSQGILPIMAGDDVIAQAQSGTGKTGTFTIATLAMVDYNITRPQVLVLAPVRELANQIASVYRDIGKFTGVKVVCLTGGTNHHADAEALRSGAQIVVGCPGRVIHMLMDGHLNPEEIQTFVIDECDEMLSQGFRDQIFEISRCLSPDIQFVLVSATFPPDVLELSQAFMRNPTRILVPSDLLTLEGIQQFFVRVENDMQKFGTLIDLYKSISITQAVIFCNTRSKASELHHRLTERGFPAIATHGDLLPEERREMLRDFREGRSRILITTDLLSRGIDVQHVSLVFNYDLPNDKEKYLHRIGRSGRFGRKGFAINFITYDDFEMMTEITEHYKTQISELPSNIGDIIKGSLDEGDMFLDDEAEAER